MLTAYPSLLKILFQNRCLRIKTYKDLDQDHRGQNKPYHVSKMIHLKTSVCPSKTFNLLEEQPMCQPPPSKQQLHTVMKRDRWSAPTAAITTLHSCIFPLNWCSCLPRYTQPSLRTSQLMTWQSNRLTVPWLKLQLSKDSSILPKLSSLRNFLSHNILGLTSRRHHVIVTPMYPIPMKAQVTEPHTGAKRDHYSIIHLLIAA